MSIESTTRSQRVTQAEQFERCFDRALQLLARREHSKQEIKNKLTSKMRGGDVDLDVLIDQLEQKNYLSDERFAGEYIRYRSQRGYGPLKIRFELHCRGVDAEIIQQAMSNSGFDWYGAARHQRIKKFGERTPGTIKERMKQSRFLSGRGFDGEMVRFAMENQ